MSDFSTLSRLCFIALLAVSTTAATPRFKSAPQTFRQEIAETRSGTAGFSPSPVQFLDQDANGIVRAFAQGHWQALRQERWIPDPSFDPKVPTEMTFPGPSGSPVTASVPWKSIQHLVRSERDVWLISSNSLYQINNGQIRPSTWPSQRAVHQFALGPKGEIIAASEDGLFQLNQSRWDPVEAIDSGGRSWASRAVLGAGFDTKGQLWIATRAGVGCRTDSGWRFFEGHDGLLGMILPGSPQAQSVRSGSRPISVLFTGTDLTSTIVKAPGGCLTMTYGKSSVIPRAILGSRRRAD